VLVVWTLWYELHLKKYNNGMLVLFIGSSCWFKCRDIVCISWYMVEGFSYEVLVNLFVWCEDAYQ
jgi:hypothetical protein